MNAFINFIKSMFCCKKMAARNRRKALKKTTRRRKIYQAMEPLTILGVISALHGIKWVVVKAAIKVIDGF